MDHPALSLSEDNFSGPYHHPTNFFLQPFFIKVTVIYFTFLLFGAYVTTKSLAFRLSIVDDLLVRLPLSLPSGIKLPQIETLMKFFGSIGRTSQIHLIPFAVDTSGEPG